MKNGKPVRTIEISGPMVLIPLEDYEELLVEAGYKKTPVLDLHIKEARKQFKQGKAIPWEKICREFE